MKVTRLWLPIAAENNVLVIVCDCKIMYLMFTLQINDHLLVLCFLCCIYIIIPLRLLPVRDLTRPCDEHIDCHDYTIPSKHERFACHLNNVGPTFKNNVEEVGPTL